MDDAASKTQFAREWRNRRLARSDLPPVDGRAPKPLATSSHRRVEDALAAMRAVLNCILLRYEQRILLYEQFEGGLGGVQSVVQHLRQSVDAKS